MTKVAIAKKMEHTQLMLAKVRKVKAKKVKTAAVKGRRVLRKGSRKGKKVGKKHKTRKSKALKKKSRSGRDVVVKCLKCLRTNMEDSKYLLRTLSQQLDL